MQEKQVPFFMVGCRWSGIPVLRNVLQQHPNLVAIEETYFYRWSEPYGSIAYEHHYLNTVKLRAQWLKDGFSRQELEAAFDASANRQNIANRYGNQVLRKREGSGRWFDATPEHIYGLLLLRAHFPRSPIVSVCKHPYSVIASLMHSPSSSPPSLKQAVNHWLEAMQIISVFKENAQSNLIELKFEDFAAQPASVLGDLLKKLNEDPQVLDMSKLTLPTASDGYVTLLSEDDKRYILKHCARFMRLYGYEVARADETAARTTPLQPRRVIQAPASRSGRGKPN